jgi:Heavy metal binding domain
VKARDTLYERDGVKMIIVDFAKPLDRHNSISKGGTMMIPWRKLFSCMAILVVIPVGVSLGQHKHHRMTKPDTSTVQQAVYTCPMDPDVRSLKPGQCPKCGMDLVKMETSGSSDTTKAVRPTKAALINDGKYNCCLKNPYDQCCRQGEDCACYTTVKKTGTVCKECYEGWQHGKGRVPGIRKDSVKAEMEKMEGMDKD